MLVLTRCISITALFILLATSGCSIYEKYGHGRIARSKLDPQLFWVDGKGKVTCYESARDFTPTPVSLSYPVPCRDLNWQQ